MSTIKNLKMEEIYQTKLFEFNLVKEPLVLVSNTIATNVHSEQVLPLQTQNIGADNFLKEKKNNNILIELVCVLVLIGVFHFIIEEIKENKQTK